MKKDELIEFQKFISNVNFESEQAYNVFYEAFTRIFPMSLLWVPIKRNSYVFRTRNNEGFDFTTFSDLIYPPIDKVTSYSRANIPYQQVFYCSDSYESNFAELLLSWKKEKSFNSTFYITTSIWKIMDDIIVAVIPDSSNARMLPFMNKIKQFDRTSSITAQYWNLVNSFFREDGFLNPNIYKFTSALCNAALENLKKSGIAAQGVLYTSVQHNKGWNLALTKETADQKLYLEDVAKYRVKLVGFYNKPEYLILEDKKQKLIDYLSKRIIW
ncbi:MAG: hypothetical protein N3D80_02800 [Ignavibacterium album]|uniref:RES domain-containing protein n=1 Tax=Ignavibacterium album TaxID=591197 RepID=UPI0026EFF9C1|nr:RES domain-containing protein [Ignavibacterium album]MCX8104787.1 hypothetical protein [Ignavibacterium album]